METGGRAERREEKTKPQRQKGSGQGGSRQRGDGGGGSGRPPQESRRRRNTEQRYAGFGDGVERAFCTRAVQVMPSTFPVASHAGTATIRRTVVAQRDGAVLLCTYSHFGEHEWPDGEVVAEPLT